MRIIAFDYLKGIAIFLVVWCHCIQYILGETFDNTFYSIIYSFHMPLFMIISGYLSSVKIDGSIITLAVRKFRRLIIPNISWGSIVLISISILTFTIPHLLDIIKLPISCWFLSFLFCCSIAYAITYKIGIKNYVISTIILSLFSLLIPGSEFVKFFMPFFGIGLILSKTNIVYAEVKWKYIVTFGCTIIVAYLLFWSRDFYIYRTHNPSLLSNFDITQWIAYFARLLFGSAITIWFMLLMKKVEIKNERLKEWLTKLSYNSLGIYVIHYSLFSISSKYFIQRSNLNEVVADSVTLVVSFAMVVIINLIIQYLRKNNAMRLLFLGEKSNKNNLL